MPKALKFAQQFANWMGIQVPNWRAETLHQLSEVKFLFGMGMGFELPVVLLALVKFGFLNYAKLSRDAPLHDRRQPDPGRFVDHT